MGEDIIMEGVYTATYSGIHVYEMVCQGIAVMRRHSDSWLNATQILKVAGVDKGRRTKILEREILTGEHEKIQGGYGKYQGTWIPFARGVELCNQYKVYKHIRPILEYDPTMSGTRSDKTPTKAELRRRMKSSQKLAVKRARIACAGPAPPKKFKVSSSAATSPLNSDIITGYTPVESPNGGPSTPGYLHGDGAARTMSLATPLRNSIYSSPVATSSESKKWLQSTTADDTPLAAIVRPEPSGSASKAKSRAVDDLRIKNDRAMLMNIFTTDDPNYIPEWLSQESSEVNVNLVIDDQGHTAVHWAAALARIHILDLLLFQGADPRQLNQESESALVRAVQVTNNYESQTFPDLLELLHDTIPLTDRKNRTVLHHIAIAAGAEGREKAARYYADCLLSWIVRMAGGYQVDGDSCDDAALGVVPRPTDGIAQSDSVGSSMLVGSASNGSQGDIEGVPKMALPLPGGNSSRHLPTPTQSSSPHNGQRNGHGRSGFDEAACQPSLMLNRGHGDSHVVGSAVNGTNANADFAAFLNLQDSDGNTALNIAARNGDRAMVRMLIGAGASASIVNRVGLSPLDFGVDRIVEGIIDIHDADMPGSMNGTIDPISSPTMARRGLVLPNSLQTPQRSSMHGGSTMNLLSTPAEQRMHQSVMSIQRMMSDLESEFSDEIRHKHESFEDIKQQLRSTTIELAKARETIHQLHTKTTQLTEIKSRVGYLEETLARETCAVREAISALPPDSKPRHDLEHLLDSLLSSPSTSPANIDDGDPEAGLPSLVLGIPPSTDLSLDNNIEDDPEKMRATIDRLRVINQVYARRDALLRERVAALRRRADVSERERQYRQIIASCCEISEADVDIWIDRLVSAVESTDPEHPENNGSIVAILDLWIVIKYVGLRTFIPIAVAAIHQLLKTYVSKKSKRHAKRKAGIHRGDILESFYVIHDRIRSIKFYGWEDACMNAFTHFDKPEVKPSALLTVTEYMINMIGSAVPQVSTALTMAAVLDKPGSVTSYSDVMLMLGSIESLSEFVGNISMFHSTWKNFKTSMRFFERIFSRNGHAYVKHSRQIPNNGAAVKLEDCTFSWGDDGKFALKPISLTIKAGDFVTIFGRIGSGKSSFLSGLCGHMPIIGGQGFVNGRIGYVAQKPYIMGDTLRENILMGADYNKDLFRKVIEACALAEDIRQLPAQDMTMVGPNGINLSGGQIVRLALAR
ncbi:transcriptional regulator swi6 [Coemansia interrupta]|uniref:Transcriptional regulator swi6 n=1 Tax=Coemansia interrupta TaxID=1126814 RepID=A0A9W8LPF6_9FUNG|nr:transcriptional regulator swi6 [Coemansia interrupta]